jgi:hypothetical protein
MLLTVQIYGYISEFIEISKCVRYIYVWMDIYEFT